MTEYLYRFRSVARLLGDDTHTGELIGRFIYFASPEQLNDPLEGHRELCFSGDKIVWNNLFKYYIRCLALRSLQYLTDPDFPKKPFPVIRTLDNLSTEVSSKIYETEETFTNNTTTIKFIENLSSSERKVTKHELLVHLRSMHIYSLHLAAKMFADIGMVPRNTKILEMTEEECLRSPTALLAETENLDGSAYEVAIYAADGKQFLKNYDIYKSGENTNWHRICLNFTDEFIDSLKNLTHEEWYTACFMDSCANSSIWGSYGDHHAGICMKFKPNISNEKKSLPFHMPIGVGTSGDIWGDKALSFHKVKYEGDAPELDFFRSIGVLTRSQLMNGWYSDGAGNLSSCADVVRNEREWQESYWARRQESITTKMPDWINENEYRLILESGLSRFDSTEGRCLKYDFNSLEGIIFGIKTSPTDKYKIIKIIEELCDANKREGFQFYQAYHDTKTKTIKYRPLLTVSCDPQQDET